MIERIDWDNEPAGYRLEHKVASGLFGEDSPDGGHLIGRCADWSLLSDLFDAARTRFVKVFATTYRDNSWTVTIAVEPGLLSRPIRAKADTPSARPLPCRRVGD